MPSPTSQAPADTGAENFPPRPPADRGAARLRRRLRRRVRTRRLVAVAVASSAALGVSLRAGGGTTDVPLVTVAVATRDLTPGEEIDAGSVRSVEVPTELVPSAAVVDPVGRTVVAAVHAGEVVHRARLTFDRLGLLADEVAVALARPPAPLPLADGDVVHLVGVTAGGQGGVRAAELGSARVLAVDDDSVTVAVRRAEAVALVEQRARGTIEILLTPTRP